MFLFAAGFDMFRHHIGQMNCDVARFQRLESEIHSLNYKLADIEHTRQNCLEKLNELYKEVRHNQMLFSVRDEYKMPPKKNNDLALKIIHNYIERIEALLRTDAEPFMVDVIINGDDEGVKKISSSTNDYNGSSQLQQANNNNNHNYRTETPKNKRQQIKNAYNHLIRSVMPKLFGKQFAHKDIPDYCSLKQNLTDLRDQVNSVNISDEQKLVDAKRIFLQEIDGYLRTIDEMVTCNVNGCTRCS